jgi:hypothetical protein
MRFSYWAIAAALLVSPMASAESQPASPAPTYADLADLALAAPLAAHVRVAKAREVEAKLAPGLKPGLARLYVEADVVALVRAPGTVPARVSYVVDLPRDAKGKAPKLRKGTDLILLASPVSGRPGELRLAAPDAQLAFTPERLAQLRAIVREVLAPAAPPRIAGIGRAFHVPGAVRGESETQIFLLTSAGEPVSLNVLRRPGETPQWAVALGEIVDEAAEPPARDTLLWYRLACGLPRTLPRQSLAEADRAAAAAIEADYRLILERLGPCIRNRAPR